MSAKDITLEDLGYILKEQNKNYLRYFKQDFNYHTGDWIEFDLKNKRFRLTNVTCQMNRHFRYGSIEELQAIYNKCKELGWLDE